MKKLVLLGGPTGVGKTTALHRLRARIDRCAVLDADDVWRVSDELAIDENRNIAIRNVVGTMRGYFETDCRVGIVSWVFARAELYQPIVDALSDGVDSIQWVYLVSEPEVLATRLNERGEPDKFAYAKTRLELIQALPFPKIDTSKLTPDQVADRICEEISR